MMSKRAYGLSVVFPLLLVVLISASGKVVQAQHSPMQKDSNEQKQTAATDDAVAKFYSGKRLRILVPASPGGAFDIAARVVARHFSKHVPGNPRLIVQNRPGGGSLIMTNAVYNTEPKDGTVIGMATSGLVTSILTGQESVQYDPRKFQYLGALQRAFFACLVRSDAAKSLKEVIDGKEVVIGGLGKASGTYQIPLVLKAAIGANFKVVGGYPGMSRARMATRSKELDGYCLTFVSMVQNDEDLLGGRDPLSKVLVVLTDKVPDHPWLKGVPTATELAQTQEAKELIQIYDLPSRITMPFFVAPGVPEERVRALREAFVSTLADPQFLADAKKTRLNISPSTGQEVTEIMNQLLNVQPSTVKSLNQILR